MRFRLIFSFACLLAATLLLGSETSYAQTNTATISGQIADASGRLVPGAIVVLTNLSTNAPYNTRTNSSGVYNLSALPPGTYRANITRDGFKSIVKSGIELHTQDNVSLNFSLQVGSVTETITVSAAAEHLETDNPAVGVLINRDFVENIPLNGRSIQDLIALAPGTVSSANANGLFSVNGQRDDANYYVVDGVASNTNATAPSGPTFLGETNWDLRGLAGVSPAQTALGTTQALISVDALQEFKIQTAGYSAEYGRQPGGQVELTSRSGTNKLHGSLFDYFRNTVMDANNYLNNYSNLPRPDEHQNDFGGTFGGPIEVPSLYNGTDKSFFFFSYEGLRLVEPQVAATETVPSVEFRKFASPEIAPFLNSFPLPNRAENGDECAAPMFTFSCTATFVGIPPSTRSAINSFSVRLDQLIGQQYQLFARYAQTASNNATFGAQYGIIANNTHSITVGLTSRVKPTLLDELRFSYTFNNGTNFGAPAAYAGAVPYSSDLLVPHQYAPKGSFINGIFESDFLAGTPNLNYFGNPPVYGQNVNKQSSFNVVNTISWTKGSHDFKFGMDYRRLSTVYNPGPYSVDLAPTSIDSVQQGTAEVFVNSVLVAHPTFDNVSLFAEDHWKITPRLTLDAGLRWEFNPAPGASNGTFPLALSSSDVATATIAPEGSPQYHTRYHQFAPRLGFAFTPFDSKSHSVVVRGGFGIFYDTGQALGANGYGGYPFTVTNNIPSATLPVPVAELAPPPLVTYPSGPPPYGGCCGISGVSDPNLVLPYTEQWNLSVDQSLSTKNTLTLSYVGNEGHKLLVTEAVRSNPNFNYFNFISNAASSNYQAFQVQDQGYILHDLQIVGSYTWAHAIDNDSVDASSPTGPLFAEPWRGNSDNDLRHVLSLATTYQVPNSNAKPFLKGLTHGWMLSSRFAFQSGYPITVMQNEFCSQLGCVNIAPDLTPGANVYLHNVPNVPFGWQLNPAAFSQVPVNTDGSPITQGNVGRNSFRGPDFWTLNSSVQRSIPLGDKLALNFRVDAFNVFNHPIGGNVNTCLCAGPQYFGTLLGTQTIGVANSLYALGGPRSLQLSLRLQF